jgi:hypothetical protein
MRNFEGCQLPCLPYVAEGLAESEPQSLMKRIKRTFAKPWNYHVKNWLKRFQKSVNHIGSKPQPKVAPQALKAAGSPPVRLAVGDRVRVRSREEIQSTLDSWHELKGCAILDSMWQYCDTSQTVVQSMERFLDERDYKVKKCRGIILLDNVFCPGTPVFGRCDRRCYLFWREEWLEKIT